MCKFDPLLWPCVPTTILYDKQSITCVRSWFSLVHWFHIPLKLPIEMPCDIIEIVLNLALNTTIQFKKTDTFLIIFQACKFYCSNLTTQSFLNYYHFLMEKAIFLYLYFVIGTVKDHKGKTIKYIIC